LVVLYEEKEKMSEPFKISLDQARTGEKIDLKGRRLEVVGASSLNALAQIRLVYAGGARRSYYPFALDYLCESAIPFDHLMVKNEAQVGEYIELLATYQGEEFKYKRREDQTISNVVDASDTDTHTKLNDIHTDVAATQSNTYVMKTLSYGDLIYGNILTKGYIDLRNASYYSAAGTTTTVITAVANTTGFIIRYAPWFGAGSCNAKVLVDGNPLHPIGSPSAGESYGGVIENHEVPAGSRVEILGSSGITATLWGEVRP